MKRLLLIPLLLFFVTGCSHITMLRTEEIQEINDDVRADLKKDLRQTNLRLDSLRKANSLLEEKLSAQEQLLNRMKADLSILATRMADESVRNDTRQEEISYRLDLLLGKSDKILAKKVVVSGAPQAPISLDSIERQANLLLEMETMFNTARADFLRGEYNKGFVKIRGQLCPILGRVCMDATMVDVSHIPNIQVGEVVDIVNGESDFKISMESVAEEHHTIPYEITVRVARRLYRKYIWKNRMLRWDDLQKELKIPVFKEYPYR